MTGVRWTPEQYADFQRKSPVVAPKQPSPSVGSVSAVRPKYKSKAEIRYADILECDKLAGRIADWGYEEVTLVVGKGGARISRFTPDFVVHHHDRSIELREVKGYMKDDARAKLLSAVKLWGSFKWTLVWSKRTHFDIEALN